MLFFLYFPMNHWISGFTKSKGILGNPVFRAFEEIRISKDNLLIIPQSLSLINSNNLSFSGFTPVILMTKNSDSLNFTFDSGAMSTMLYKPYLDKYSGDIKDKYELIDINIGGAGGRKTVKGYNIKDVTL